MLKLMDGERIICGAGTPLCLTTHRVHSERADFGSEGADQIFLEHVSYQALSMSSRPVYLVFAGLAVFLGVFGIFSSDDRGFPALAILGFSVAIGFVIAYFVTRRQELVIASSGGSLRLAASSIPRDTLDWFLGQLALAKESRRCEWPRPSS